MGLLDTLKGLLGFEGQVKIGEVTVDASVAEGHTLEGDVTEHPVEKDSDISDNYRVRPRTVQIEGVISDTPLSTGFPGETLVNSIGSALSGASPSKTAWDQIQDYFDNAQVIDISTSLQSYPNMVLTNFSVARDAKNGQNLRFSCTAKRLRVVQIATVDALKTPETTTGTGGSKSKGAKGATDSPASGEKSKSILAKGLDAGKGFFGL